MKLTIFTDGASRGNPGQASYGFVILDDNTKILYERGKYIGVNTNNFAEYSAVLEALNYVTENYDTKTEVNFFMDSKLVVEQLKGRWKIKSPTLTPLVSMIKSLEEKLSYVGYNHVPREKNKQADRLCNIALDSL
jgi:ribonuclease H / adenosylcobalamin/alpha-ribazole phosphatase